MGGKPVFQVPGSIINFDSGFSKKLLCDGPTFSAGTSCQYSCSFCYVPSAMRKQMGWLVEHGVKGNHEDVVIRRANPVAVVERQLRSKPKQFLQTKRTIFASPLVDVAANMDLVRETVEICKSILSLTNWDIRLLSKSSLLPKVAEGLSGNCGEEEARKRVIYGVSTGTLDDNLAAAFEEGCPKVSKRIESLHWIQDNGFRTFGMICPSLPTWQPGMTEAEAYAKFAGDVASAIRSDRCEHVWAEVINLRGESFTRTINALQGAGYGSMAQELTRVSHNGSDWEQYARNTFLAHADVYAGTGKLRFLQYTTKPTHDWWSKQVEKGAVLL